MGAGGKAGSAHFIALRGGKDSLVVSKLLEEGGLDFDSLAYSSSLYGSHQPQHDLIDGMLDQCVPKSRRRQWVFDDFLDAPLLKLDKGGHGGSSTLCSAETPFSIFAALPWAMAFGYDRIVLGHEKSADEGNMVWDLTGEVINHQWGKSFEAEMMLSLYVKKHLCSSLEVGSALKPIGDPVIFELLSRHPEAARATHSCNVKKPWCMRCAKCAYVWLGMMGSLPHSVVESMFGVNLADLDENQLSFRQLIGLEARTPFECVGQPSESRLAMAYALDQGATGKAFDVYRSHFDPSESARTAGSMYSVEPSRSALPADVMDVLLPQMRAAAVKGIERARELAARAS